jgi:DNA-binding MarR family transcriptional regulator
MSEVEARTGASKNGGTRVDRRTAGRFLELLGAMKRYVREELPPFPERGMSEEKFRSLLSLRLLGRSPLKSLAEHDGLSSSAKCIMLNRLVEEGFAARADDPRDRRNVFYELTGPGLVLLNAEIDRRSALLGSRLDVLGKGGKARFARAVETLLAGVSKLRSAGRNEVRDAGQEE